MPRSMSRQPAAAPKMPGRRWAGAKAVGSSWARATQIIMPATSTIVPVKNPGVNRLRNKNSATRAPAGSARPETNAASAPLARLLVA